MPAVSDLLTAAAEALGTPEALVQRSAAARAEAAGSSVDDVLSAWAGGAPIAAPAPATGDAEPAAPPPSESEPATQPAAVATIEVPVAQPEPAMVVEQEPEEPVDPVPVGLRVRTATRVGAWAGAGLGLVAFLVAGAWWATNASLTGDGPFTPVVVVDSTAMIIGTALISVVFGAVVAGLSRSAAAWANPGMRLSNSASSTAWLGAFIGLILGVIAGAILTSGFGTAVEGSEGMSQLPVLPSLFVMIIGGAVLGAITAATTQAVGVPVAVDERDTEEVEQVRRRLSGALSIPLVGALLLVLLVLPFAYALLESNHLTAGGAAILAILVSAGILTFAYLAGGRPNMKISFGEAMVAVIGIATVAVIVFAVLLARSPAEGDHEAGEEAETAITQLLA